MMKRYFWLAFAVGLAAIGWVAVGFAGGQWLAFAMTLAIAAAYLVGANELRLLRADSRGLAAALDDSAPAINDLGDWLQRVPPALRGAVRLRIEQGRGGLPGPALTPYLVGLLVMLGMLGTFLGMVVTFKGAVFALEGSTDLQAIRAALAEPIRGLGLSFGTSVAGVAASAMLGLMSAISRRERLDVARLLDARIATLLRPFSLAHQREESLRAAQAQAGVLPRVADKLDALMERIEQRSQQLDQQLLQTQAKFHDGAAAAYAQLAREVGSSLQDALAAGGRAAGDSVRPVMEAAMARIADDQTRKESERLQAWTQQLQAMAAGVGAQWQATAQRADAQAVRTAEGLAALLAQTESLVSARVDTEARWLDQHGERMEQLADVWRTQLQALRQEESRRGDAAIERLAALQAAAADVLAQLREEMARVAQQENIALQERTVLVERLGMLVQTVEAASRQAGDMAAQAGANAIELSAWGEAFGHGVQLFNAGNEKLVAALQQLEGAVGRSSARSDEQLAYYVTQAREVIDLSIASQHGVIERLRELAASR